MEDERKESQDMKSAAPPKLMTQAELALAISERIAELMQEKGLSKKEFADALGKRPSEVTRWLSGHHNFRLSTLAMLSVFFGQSIVEVYTEEL